MKLGLIGYPLSHSFSPDYFARKFQVDNLLNHTYKSYPIESILDIESIFSKGVDGLNVTIPYKELVIPFLDQLSNESYEIGAVNTIKIVDGLKIGYNTDVYGFKQSILDFLEGTQIEKALVLGSGGGSKAILFALRKLEIEPIIVSRSGRFLNYNSLDKDIIRDHKLIVNTTPLGMFPNQDSCPDIPYEYLTEKHFLFDLVYNPEKTLFLNKGTAKGCQIKNGYDMLCLQAEKSWEIWKK